MSYCKSNNKYYKIDDQEESTCYEYIEGYQRTEYYKTLRKCELIFVTVDVVARNPDYSKEYDRYNVSELKPLKKSKPIKIRKVLIDRRDYELCDAYVYEKINE